jgi:aminoglycoside phosphotransferase (APT) family kinase protein
MSFKKDLQKKIKKYTSNRDFQIAIGITENVKVEFLAQGEYNINFLLKDGEDKFVMRINLGSQMDLKDQIGYEFHALEQLAPSGVTPRPYYLDNTKADLPYGMLVMEYLSGRPLKYQYDLKPAAEVFAKIHELDISEDTILIKEENPLTAIWNECNDLIEQYLHSDLANKEIKDFLIEMKEYLFSKKDKEKEIMDLLPLSIVNTEVNSGNFIINESDNKAYLVDWEKPLITSPLQDLSHFMVPTTTLWKTDFIFNQGEEEEFLHHYINARNIKISYQKLLSALDLFNRFSAMRGISWSAMAWVEYQKPGRLIKNEDTFRTMDNYLRKDFLEMLFPDIN